MLLYVFILAIFHVALAFPSKPFGNGKCNDVLVACKDIQAAQSCKAVIPCIHVWEHVKVPEDNNEICDLCKEMVKEARDQLMSNETQEEIKEVFEGTCRLIPIKAITDECISVVDQLIPTLIESLASRMDPTQVCTVAGLCNNGQLLSIMKSQISELAPILIRGVSGKSDKCAGCKSSMTFVKKVLKFTGLDTFTQLTYEACQKEFHGTLAECAKLVNGVLPVAAFINTHDEETVCSLKEDCCDPKKVGIGCSLCKEFVGAAASLEESQVVLKSIEDYFLVQCVQIESDPKQQELCKDTVKNIFPVMEEFLWSKEDPLEKCKSSGICSGKQFGPKKTENQGLGPEICDACHTVFNYIRDKAMTLEVKEAVQRDIDKLCAKTGQFGPFCQSLVDQYFSYFYDSLVTDLTPDVICIALNLCSNQRAVAVKIGQHVCKFCELYRKYDVTVKDQVVLAVKKAAEEKLEKICKTEFHGTNVEHCEVIVKDVIPVVFHYLKSVDPSVFCGAMKSCPLKYPLPKPVGDNLTCEFCEALVQYVRNFFTSASTKEEFRTAFTNMCKDLRRFSSECSSLVDEYFDQFYDFITQQLDSKLVCTALGLCGDSLNVVKMTKTFPATPISKGIDIYPALTITKQANRIGLRIMDTDPTKYEHRPGISIRLPESSFKTNRVPTDSDIETNEIDGEESHPPQLLPPERFLQPSMVVAQNDFACIVCKSVIQYLDDQLKDNKTEEEIRDLLDKVCSYLSGELEEQCTDFVNEYTDMIVNLLIQEVNPDEICAMLKVCPSTIEMSTKDIPIKQKGVLCEICVKIMQYVEKELEDNSTEEAIRQALDKACSYLPQPYGQRCQDFMDKYSEMIFELLSKEVAPRMICSFISICPFGSLPKVNGNIECQICQYSLHYIQGRLMDNATEAEIKQALENACAELPEKLAVECRNYIEQYGDAILALLAQELDPTVICVKLGICPGIDIHVQPGIVSPIVNIKELKIDTCGTCEIVVDYMDKLLENDDIDREIVKLVEKVCAIVPKSTREQCQTIIEAYGPYILQMIGQLADSKEVCQAIDLCSRTPGHVHLVGGEKCTFGPTYWCQSSAHASACKAENYCKEKVW